MLDNPIEAYLQVARAKNQNRLQANQDIANIGQGLGQSLSAVGQQIQAQKQKDLMDQLVLAMKSNGQVPQGPQMPIGPMVGAINGPGPQGYAPPNSPNAVPVGQYPMSPQPKPIDNSQTIKALMMKLDPQSAVKAAYEQQDPYKQALTAQANAEAQAKLRPPKPVMEYTPYGESPGGTGLVMDKTTGKVTDTGTPVSPKKDPAAQDFKEQVRQDRLEKTYVDRITPIVKARNGQVGIQDAKVNQAIDLRTMINDYYDPATKTYNVPPSLHSELVLGLAKLLSPTGTVGVEMMNELKQHTARENLANMAIRMGMDPKTAGGPTQGVINMFVHTIDRQGKKSEELRDKYINGLKELVPTGLAPERMASARKTVLTSSFKDALANSPDQMGGSAQDSPGPAQVTNFTVQ